MKDIRFTLLRVMVCGLVLLAAMVTAQAQFKAGIQGTVSDSGGGLVPEAKITLTSKETGKTQDTTSSPEGFYRLSGLAPGSTSSLLKKPVTNKRSSTIWQSMPRQC